MADINEIFSQGALDGIQKAIEMMAKLEISVTKLVQQSKQLDATLSKASGIKSNTEQQKALNKGKSEAARIQQAYQRELEKTKVVHGAMSKALIAQKTANQQATAEIKRNQAVVKSAAGSYDQLNAALKRDIAEFKKLSAAERENSQRGKELKNSIQQNKKALKDLDKQMRNYKSALQGLNKVMGLLGITAGIAALRAFGKKLIDTATSMEQVSKRARIVFGDSFPKIEKTADAVAKKMGVTNMEFINMATNTGDLLIPLDFTREKAAELSIELQSLTGALDEWTGGTIGATEVSAILTKAMLGENEQLKRLGIAIRQDSDEFINLVKQKQADEGVTKAQARALATLELIRKKSLDAQTAYISNENNLMRVRKKVNLLWKQSVEFISGFINPQKTTIDLMEDERTRMNSLFEVLKNTNTAQETRKRIIDEINTRYGGYLTNVITETTKVNELAAAQDLLNKKLLASIIARKMADEQEEYNQALLEYGEMAYQSSLAAAENQKVMENAYGSMTDQANAAKKTMEAVRESVKKAGEEYVASTVSPLDKITEKYKAISKILGVAFDDVMKAMNGTTQTVIENTTVTDANTESIEDQARAYMKLIAEQERLATLEDVPGVDVGDVPEADTEKWRTDADYYNEIWRESYEGRMQTLKDQLKAGEISEAEYKDKILAIKQEQADKEQEIGEERAEKAVELASMIASRTMEIYQQSIDQQIQSLETQKQYELNLNQGSLEAQERIQKKYAKKEAELKRKKAIADKAAALVQAAINTAVAVTAATTAGPGIGLALAIITAAFNAIQLGVIASQPIPQFRKGTKASPAGLAIVGEEGTELMIGPRGQVALSGDKPEARMLHAGTRVFTAKETQKIMAAAKGYDSYEMMAIAETIREGDEKIYRAIKDQPQFTVQKDKRRVTERRGSYYKTYLNAKLGI